MLQKPLASFRDVPDVTYTSDGKLQSARRQNPKSTIKLGTFLHHRHKVACATNPELEANSRYWAPFWNSSNLRYPATHPRSKAHNHAGSSSYRDALCCWATENFHPETLKTQHSRAQTPSPASLLLLLPAAFLACFGSTLSAYGFMG